jgi:hypothetical protein
VNVALVAVSADHGPIESVYAAPWWKWDGKASLLAGDGVKHNNLCPHLVYDEDATVAAPEQLRSEVTPAVADSQVEAPRRDAVGRVQDGGEHDILLAVLEDAEEGRLPVVGAKAGDELGVCGEAPPAPADGGGAREGGGLRREAEDYLMEHVVAVRQGGTRRRRAAAAAGQFGALALTHVGGLGNERLNGDGGVRPRMVFLYFC